MPPVYWLNGLAGTGKTTIAQTIVDNMKKEQRLGASFFYSRTNESNPKNIFPVLAYELTYKYPDFRLICDQIIYSNPGILYDPPCDQMEKLIIGPLKASAISTVIVIDALDECKDKQTISAIFSALGKISNVKFLITSRPQPHIQECLAHLVESKLVTISNLHEVERSQDIQKFFKEKLPHYEHMYNLYDDPEAKEPYDWPTEIQLESLSNRAAGIFVYANAIMHTLIDDSGQGSPRKRLESQLRLTSEGAEPTPGGPILRSLYMSTLQEAFGHYRPEDCEKVNSILRAIVLPSPITTPSTIAMHLDLDVRDVRRCVESIQALLIFKGGNDDTVKPFHRSFSAVLTDPYLCTDKRFYVPLTVDRNELREKMC